MQKLCTYVKKPVEELKWNTKKLANPKEARKRDQKNKKHMRQIDNK